MEFRAAWFSAHYAASLEFYGEGLGLPRVESWDRGPDDRGTLFEAGVGRIEVLARPRTEPAFAGTDLRAPQGVTLVLEVEDVAATFERAGARGLPLRTPLVDQPWGHRSFMVTDPDGVAVYVFTPLAGDDA
jgi:catechol 2,3-dioxygenase-like lactoylglutathione lyase family enzyme